MAAPVLKHTWGDIEEFWSKPTGDNVVSPPKWIACWIKKQRWQNKKDVFNYVLLTG